MMDFGFKIFNVIVSHGGRFEISARGGGKRFSDLERCVEGVRRLRM
jgi:hypothetical protein